MATEKETVASEMDDGGQQGDKQNGLTYYLLPYKHFN